MKVTYLGKKFSVDFDGTGQKEIFEQIGVFQEVFEETNCGNCGSDNIKFVVRDVEKDGDVNKYYELLCKECFCRLSFGHHKTGNTMYPKRYKTNNKGKMVKDDKGKPTYLGKNGWHKYQAEAVDSKEDTNF